MTTENMARHATSEHYEFWRMLKTGYDHFEVTKRPPTIEVCDKKYVFNANPTLSGSRFDAKEICPAYEVPKQIAQAVAEKQERDNREIAEIRIAMENKKRRKERIASFFGGKTLAEATAPATQANIKAAKALALTNEKVTATPASRPPEKATETDPTLSYFTSLFTNMRTSEQEVVAASTIQIPEIPIPTPKPD